ncbi:hypothetical protein [Streptomyces sp. NPDC001937]
MESGAEGVGDDNSAGEGSQHGQTTEGLPAVWIGIPWWTVLAVGGSAVVCAAGLMHHRLRPRAAGGV